MDLTVCAGCGMPTLPPNARPHGWQCPHCTRQAALDDLTYGSIPVDCLSCADIGWLRGYGGMSFEQVDRRMRRRRGWARSTWERHHTPDGEHGTCDDG